jgi:multiple sugar transport system ATP-binding protein
MSVRENISFGLKIRKVPRAKQQEIVARVAKTLQIEHLLERMPAQLSGGQRQRVAMGRALARDPALFLFDEPLSNLDAKLRVAMRAEISKLHRRLGATIIYVTHDQVEAMTMADRIFIMNQGLQQSGTPLEVYTKPVNRFVAGFIGSPAMNFVDAKVAQDAGQLFIDADHLRVRVPEPFRAALQPYAGRAVVFGVRPEDITLHDPAAGEQGHSITARADVVETLGSEIFAHLSCGPHAIVARMEVPETPLRVGDTVEVALKMAKTHVFDAQTSLTIV